MPLRLKGAWCESLQGKKSRMLLYHCHLPLLWSHELYLIFHNHGLEEVLIIEDVVELLLGYLLSGVAPQRRRENRPPPDPSLSSDRSTLTRTHNSSGHPMCSSTTTVSSNHTSAAYIFVSLVKRLPPLHRKQPMSHFGVGWETCLWQPELLPSQRVCGTTPICI